MGGRGIRGGRGPLGGMGAAGFDGQGGPNGMDGNQGPKGPAGAVSSLLTKSFVRMPILTWLCNWLVCTYQPSVDEDTIFVDAASALCANAVGCCRSAGPLRELRT